jgi:2'-5' RNA ligase
LSCRLFAALELPPELQHQLAALQNDLKAAAPPRSVRWVRPEGIHLTLKFYGDVAAERLPPLQAGLARAANAAEPAVARFALAVEGVGVFPNAARPAVVWAGVKGALAPLQRLQAAVEAEALALGFKPEGRAYHPHLTLGRVNEGLPPEAVRRLMEAVGSARGRPVGGFTPDHLSLMNSALGAGGSVYTRLSTAPLAPQARPA